MVPGAGTPYDDAASQVAWLEAWLEGGGDDSVDDEVGTEAPGEFLDGFDGSTLRFTVWVGRRFACACQLILVDDGRLRLRHRAVRPRLLRCRRRRSR